MGWSSFDIQPQVVSILRRAMNSGRTGHAYIFSGLAGTGKLEAAIRLAMSLNCETMRDGDHCEQCRSCSMIWKGSNPAENNYPDLLHLVPGEWEKQKSYTIVMDAVRAMSASIKSAPISARRRMVIIHDADVMNEDSQNAFLKTLEEPLEGLRTTFVLLTTRPDKLLPTIRSRCQEIKFRRIAPERIKAMLSSEYEIPGEGAAILAALSDGSMGKARELAKGDLLNERREWLQALDAAYGGDAETAMKLAEEIGSSRETFERFLEFLLLWHRDLLAYAGAGEDGHIINLDMLETLRRQTGILSQQTVMTQMEKVQEMLDYLPVNIRGDLALLDFFAPLLNRRKNR